MTALRIGVVGAGQISGAYLGTLRRLSNVQVVAVADLDQARARTAAAAAPGARPLATAELLTAGDVDLVLNLTIPAAHAEVAHAAIAAGKHVYGEKPLAVTTGQAHAVLAAAARAGVRVGCAPDTVLGTGVQTAAPAWTTARSARRSRRPRSWSRPATSGGIRPRSSTTCRAAARCSTWARTISPRWSRCWARCGAWLACGHSAGYRTIGSGPRAGAEIGVAVATHVTGVLEHANGALSTLVMSFDVWAGQLPHIEVYGTGGSLSVPDPNGFGGAVQIFRAGAEDWAPVAEAGGYRGATRGYGVSDLASALTTGTAHRANGEVAYHVLDMMEGLLVAADSGHAVDVTSSCDRPPAVPFGARPDDPRTRPRPAAQNTRRPQA